MKNFLSKLWSLSRTDRVRTLAIDAVSLPSFCRVNMLKLVSILVLVLTVGVGNAWAVAPKTSDLNFGSAAVSATFESESVKSVSNNTSSAATNSSLTGYGPFTASYLGKNANGIPSIAIVDGGSDGDDPMTSKYFAITSTNNGASVSSEYTNNTGKGAFSFKITKTSKLTIGLYNGAASGSFGHANAAAYLQFDGGSNIKISAGNADGSGSPKKWDQIVSSSLPSTDILEIAVVYNTTNSSTTYGGSITLAANSAHVYINGTAADDGNGNAKDFYIGGNTIANFLLFDNTAGRKTSCVDDIMIYSALPTAAASGWKLKGSFDSWGDGYAMTGSGTVSVTRSLAANTRYEFKIYDGSTAYGNNGAIVGPMSGWVMSSAGGVGNCRIHTANAGEYTFSLNTSTKELTVTYPSVTHPSEYYVYFKNSDVWGMVYGFMTGGSGDFAGWPGTVTNTTTICGETYHYAALLDNGSVYNKIIFNNGGTGYGNQTSDLTMPGAGKYNANRDANWHTFDKYTISYDKGTGTGGSMSSHTDLCPGSSQQLTANAFSKAYHTFNGWSDGNGHTYADQAMIENIQSNINLTAQWAPEPYDITATLTNVTSTTSFPVVYTYTGSAAGVTYTFAAADGFRLPDAVTVTGSTYTWDQATGQLTLTGTITGAVSITISGVQTHTVTWHVGDATSTTSNVNHGTTFSTLEASAPAHADNALAACGSTKFIGWVKAAGAWTEDGKAVDWYNTHKYAAADEITDDVDIYAMYAEASGGGTSSEELTADELTTNITNTTCAYGSEKTYTDNSKIAYAFSCLTDVASRPWVQMKKDDSNAYIKITAPGNITQVDMTITSAANASGGVTDISKHEKLPVEAIINLNTEKTNGTSYRVAYVAGDGSSTSRSIVVSSPANTILYLQPTGGACRIWGITVHYSSVSYSNYRTGCTETCGAPTNPTNTSITAYGATIGWTGGGTGTLDRYEYAVWMDGDDEPTSGFTSNGTNTSNALTGLLSNTTYRWKVRKVCTGGDGESMWLKSSFTTSNVALTFSVPTGASAVPGQNSDEALPSAEVPTNCGDCWAFVGWTTAEHAESSSAPAKLFASDAIVHLAQADGSTLYAVYKKDEFKLIKATSQMENNGYYVLTSLHESHEYAMTNVLNGKYATSTDVTSLISEPEVDNYLLKNPSESTIWKFTGTASSGRFYNESSGLYLDLTEKEGAILKSSTTDNLVITIPNVKELAFDIASVAESSHYLYMWTSHQWSVDNAHRIGTDNRAYLYKRISLVYATTPSCPIYTVTWDVNGASTSTTEVTKCEGYLSALPGAPADNTLSGCQTNGKFMGWSASKVMPAQDIAPADIFSEVEDAPEITEDVTFYAVFANGVAGAATPVNTTYTFNSKLWGDATNSWSSNTAGSELTSERGIQILGNTSAEGITKNNYTDVTKVVVTYCTNASSGAGSVTVTVGDTEFGTNSISKPSSGGATLKTFTYTHAAATGKVKISASASSSSIYIYSVQIYYTGAGTVYEQYRTACCNDPGFSFTGENDAPVTEYVIVRENMASASDAVEIDCNYTSSNTTGAITWYSTRRAAKTFPSTGAYTWTTPTEQPTNLNIDLANKKIAAKETGVWTITISQADGGTTYCPVDAVVTVRVKTVDKFIDNVNGNFSGEAQRLEDVGNGITLPTETTFTINGGCSDGVTRRLVGWIKASDLATYASGGRVNKIDDWKTADPATNKVIAPGTKVQATGVTWYAVWGVEK